MKCQVTSSTTHDVLISKEISYKSYREICSGEPKKVNIGFNNDFPYMLVENNTLISTKPEYLVEPKYYIYGKHTAIAWNLEVLSKFFAIHNFEPNFLDCNGIWGRYDEDLGGWTGCMGKV